MEQTKVQKLAQVLWVLVMVVFVCNIVALFFVPFYVRLYGFELSLDPAEAQHISLGTAVLLEPVSQLEIVKDWLRIAVSAFADVWTETYTAVLTLFLWACGICTAIILWQGKRVLDTILRGEPFTLANAANLRRAAVCCFVISGAALARTVWGMVYYQSALPLLTYNALFVPVFLLAGLLCMVMSALFRQAAELKADKDLTI